MLKTFDNKEVIATIRREIITSLRSILDDPDFGLQFTEKGLKRLRMARASKKRGVSFDKIKSRYY